jgi:hypothetical protein
MGEENCVEGVKEKALQTFLEISSFQLFSDLLPFNERLLSFFLINLKQDFSLYKTIDLVL